jgi:hypothetical protein
MRVGGVLQSLEVLVRLVASDWAEQRSQSDRSNERLVGRWSAAILQLYLAVVDEEGSLVCLCSVRHVAECEVVVLAWQLICC